MTPRQSWKVTPPPSYLEVLLTPLGAYTLLGLPMDELRGQTVDLVEVVGADGRRLGEQLREIRAGGSGSRCWTGS
jgi:hypothetical protein